MPDAPKSPPKKLIIALTGRKRTGKTTIAEWLARSYGAFIARSNVAIHHTTRQIFELDLDQLEGPRKDLVDDRWGLPPRTLMERVGTAVRHVFGESIWARRAASGIMTGEPGLFVFDNVRFEAEVEALRQIPDAQVIVWKTICTSDAPDPDEDPLTESRIDEITADTDLHAGRDGTGEHLCTVAIDALVVLLEHQHPELIGFFDPGEGAPDTLTVVGDDGQVRIIGDVDGPPPRA